MNDRYYTCQKCSEIVSKYGISHLDDKPICSSCMFEIRYGNKRRECNERGYHITRSHSGGIGGTRDGRGAAYECTAHCECSQDAYFYLENYEKKRGALGIEMPEPPKYWTFVSGNPVGLTEKDIAKLVKK